MRCSVISLYKLAIMKIVLLCVMMCLWQMSLAQDQYAQDFQKRYEENIQKEYINEIYIPVDVEDAVNELDKIANEESRAKLRGADEEVVVERLSRGLGKWMMANWNFYEGSRLSHQLKKMGVSKPDDMSTFVIRSYYRHINEIPLDLEARAKEIFEKRRKEQEERNKKNKVSIIPN